MLLLEQHQKGKYQEDEEGCIMDVLLQWTSEWEPIYTYILQSSFRAREIAPMPFELSCVVKNGGASSSHTAFHHGRTVSTVSLIHSMEDRSQAYYRVHRCCNDHRRVEGQSARAVVFNMLDLSLRWWVHYTCTELRRWNNVDSVKIGDVDETTEGVFDIPAWKDVDHFFPSIEVETALRTALFSTLDRVHRTVDPAYLLPLSKTAASSSDDSSSSHCQLRKLHIYATLARHCFFLERVLHIQFLYLHHHKEGSVSRLFRSVVRDLISSEDVLCEIQDVIKVVGGEYLSKPIVTHVEGLLCNENFVNDNSSLSATHVKISDIASENAAVLSMCSLVIALVDACGLSPSMNDVCDALEAHSHNFGTEITAKILSQHPCSEITASAEDEEGQQRRGKEFEDKLNLLGEVKRCYRERLQHVFRCSATTLSAAKPVEQYYSLRVEACYQFFLDGVAKECTGGQRWFLSECCRTACKLLTVAQVGDNNETTAVASENVSRKVLLASLVELCQHHNDMLAQLGLIVSDVVENLLVATAHSSSIEIDFDFVTRGVMGISSYLQRSKNEGIFPSTAALITGAIQQGIQRFLSSREEVAVRSLVTYVQKLISETELNSSGGDSGVSLDCNRARALCNIVVLIHSKDAFVVTYAESLAQRALLWLSNTSTSSAADSSCCVLEADAQLCSLLAGYVGNAAVAPLTAMIRDVRVGCQNLPSSSSSNGDEGVDPTTFCVLELCCARWKGYLIPSLLRTSKELYDDGPRAWLGYDFGLRAKLFESWKYSSVSQEPDASASGGVNSSGSMQRRRLQWAMCSGSCIISCAFTSTPSVTLHCPPFVACVLATLVRLLPNANQDIDINDVVSELLAYLPAALTKATTHGLAHVGIIGRNGTHPSTIRVHLLDTSQAKSRKIRLNPLLALQQANATARRTASNENAQQQPSTTTPSAGDASKECEQRQMSQALQLERHRKLEACIVRVMKSVRSCSHRLLLERVTDILGNQFVVTHVLFKAAIGELITREYIARSLRAEGTSGGEDDGYEYMA